MPGGPSAIRAAALALAALAAAPGTVHAHTGSGAFILLLPTSLYLLGAALTVALSFALVALAPARWLTRLAALKARLVTVPGAVADVLSSLVSLAALGLAVVLVLAGLLGSRDPLANPLPLFVWSVWWIGVTYAHALLGELWVALNPWRGLYRVLTAFGPLARWRRQPPLRYPARAGAWPAMAGFLAFAWFELIHPAPADPDLLAQVVAAYLVIHLVGTLLFGEVWLRQAESFAVFFRIVAWLAPLAAGRLGAPGPGGRAPRVVEARLPALGLLARPAPEASVVVFVLLVLSSVSFDGLSRTFAWLTWQGINPLVYPGRTALMGVNTLGLLGLLAALAGGFVLAVRPAAVLAPPGKPFGRVLARLALSLVPIACGYHFAHYLPVFLVDVQRALRAASDPFARGWNLLGTADLHVVTSLLSDASRVYLIWHTQVALIVAAHVGGVVVAHALALELAGRPGAAALGQLPLLALMIGYTLLGLWLLSTPAV